MKTCFGYVRVSTVKQGDGVSLEAQREAIEHYAHRNNIHVCKWFEEKVTAAKRGRPLFNRMVTELKRGDAQGVVFHKIDRSARNFADWARIGDLAEAGIEICFATETLDFNSRGGRLTADIQAVIAADYVRNLREESIKGQIGRLKMGLFPYSAPVGYLDCGKGEPKKVDPKKAPLIRELFRLYATGEYSYDSLQKLMAQRGLTNKAGRPLTRTGIEHTIGNPFYMGLIKIKTSGKVYSGVHEPIISPGEYKAAEAVRLGRKRRKAVTRHRYLFQGLFRCGNCTGAMIAERQKRYVYYRCQTKTCPTKTVREDAITAQIIDHLNLVALSPAQVDQIRARFLNWLSQFDHAKQLNQAKFQLAKLDDRLSRLTDKFVDDHIDEVIYQAKRNEIIQEMFEWRAKANEADKTEWYLARLDELLERVKTLVSSYESASRAQKREIVLFATSNRTITGKNIDLTPPEWFQMTSDSDTVLQCGHYRGTTRTFEMIKSALRDTDA